MQIGKAEHVYSISELNRASRETLESTFGDVWVRGEISELTRASSGHVYFTLKDDDAEISAVRFRSRTSILTPTPIEQGMLVLAMGRLTVYEPRGRYQFVASLIQPVGEGALQAAIERLKVKLQDEGLFDAAHKQPLPRFPLRIGLVTSPAGAALRDLRSVFERRWPIAELFLFGSSVQGAAAPDELVAAIESARRFSRQAEPLDLLIVGRGGGSAEDLASFSDERVVRALFECPIPTISAVGHEVDFALADFVTDLRAPTPSAAAELAAPSREEIVQQAGRIAQGWKQMLAKRLETREAELTGLLRGYVLRLPVRQIETAAQRFDAAVERIARGLSEKLRIRIGRVDHAADILRLSDPYRPLQRGYSMTFLKGETEPLREAESLPISAELETRLQTGRVISRITEISPASEVIEE